MSDLNNLLKVENLFVSYLKIPVVRGVSFKLGSGESLGIVGESGCGKSTMLRALMMLKSNDVSIDGSICFSGSEITELPEESLRQLRGGQISMIPQNAFLSMDSTKNISALFYETVKMHRPGIKKFQSNQEAIQIMEELLLDDPWRILKSYPFELSGGMCQRVAIAAAMINRPKLLLADEPTSALDVAAQRQVVHQLRMLKNKFQVSVIIISHNLGVVAGMSDFIAVMYGGKIVEYGRTQEILENALHPYTKALIEAVPDMNGHISKGIPGIPPEFKRNMIGCQFAKRCPDALQQCIDTEPDNVFESSSHKVRCWRVEK